MISVVITAYNEERNISGAIESVQGLADEVIVVDNQSSDRTAEVARKKGAKVFSQKNDPLKIDLQKNFGFSKATEDWILSLDADERLTPKLISEIKSTLEFDTNTSGYYIPRKNIIFGKWIKHSIWWPDYQLRFFKKGKGKFDGSTVHKEISVKGNIKHLSEPFLHESYISISQYVDRMNRIYTEVESEKILKHGKRLSQNAAIIMPIEDFLKTYFMQKGYRDGLHGLILSLLQAFYTFLVVGKVWEKQGFYERDSKEILQSVFSDNDISYQIKYWVLTASISETRNPLKRGAYLLSRKTLSIFK